MLLPSRFVVRERRAPRPRKNTRLAGRIRWELIDRLGRIVRAGEQSNLVLNQGLNQIASSGFFNVQNHLAVGDGSAAPAVTDVGLGNEISRSNTALSTTLTRTSEGVYERERVIEFDFAEAVGNLTEWGSSPSGAAGSNLFSRELFRDGVGDPITVTKTSSEKLRVTYTLEITLGPLVATPASFDITGIGTINGDFIWARNSSHSNNNNDLVMADVVARGIYDGSSGVARGTGLSELTTPLSESSFNRSGTITVGGYTSGTFKRELTQLFVPTNDGNLTWGWFGLSDSGNTGNARPCGFFFRTDVEDRFVKEDTHELTITRPLELSWSR